MIIHMITINLWSKVMAEHKGLTRDDLERALNATLLRGDKINSGKIIICSTPLHEEPIWIQSKFMESEDKRWSEI